MSDTQTLDPSPTRRAAGALSLRLRAETRPQHEAVEALTFSARLLADDLGPAEYALILSRMLGVVEPLERRAAGDWSVDAGESQAEALAADLECLGWPGERVAALPRAALAGCPGGEGSAAGIAYVLEGSRMGGRLIARHLARSLGPDIAMRLRFHRDDPANGPRWRRVQGVLDGLPPAAADRCVAGAAFAFQAFADWMGGPDGAAGSKG